MIRVYIRNFFIVKICNFITMRFYFGFLKFFIVDRFIMKFFFDMSVDYYIYIIVNVLYYIFLMSHHLQSKNTSMNVDFIANSIIFSWWVIIFNQKIHPLNLSIITFCIDACTNTFSISTYFNRTGVLLR